jgi:hypothetical protein
MAAEKHVPRKIDLTLWELWAVNYISAYYNEILATPDSTKTTTFKRLYAMILKDYKNIAGTISAT